MQCGVVFQSDVLGALLRNVAHTRGIDKNNKIVELVQRSLAFFDTSRRLRMGGGRQVNTARYTASLSECVTRAWQRPVTGSLPRPVQISASHTETAEERSVHTLMQPGLSLQSSLPVIDSLAASLMNQLLMINDYAVSLETETADSATSLVCC